MWRPGSSGVSSSRLVAGIQVSGCVQRLEAAPVVAPVDNELVGRRSRVLHGQDPHARRGVRINRFRPTRNAPNTGSPIPGASAGPPTGWSDQSAPYGEAMRAMIESIQVG
jgi:hypothetical protein